jgi:hypothetical protein
MTRQDAGWLEQYLEKVAQSSELGREAVDYVRANKIRVGLKRARKSVGAFWTLNRRFYLNSVHYSRESMLENPRAWTLFVHEVCHLKQGPLTALSIYGELEAWQIEFRLYKQLTQTKLIPAIEEMLALPLDMNRDNLRRARALMMETAGKGYGAWILPLYPIHKEVKYWVTRRVN